MDPVLINQIKEVHIQRVLAPYVFKEFHIFFRDYIFLLLYINPFFSVSFFFQTFPNFCWLCFTYICRQLFIATQIGSIIDVYYRWVSCTRRARGRSEAVIRVGEATLDSEPTHSLPRLQSVALQAEIEAHTHKAITPQGKIRDHDTIF